jgi:hypothetical protein
MLPQLTSVSLAGQELGNEGVLAAAMALQVHVHLVHPDLRNNKLDAFGVRTLSSAVPRWPGLRALLLSSNELLSTAAADALAPGHALPQLTWLDVRPTRMTDALRAALAPLTAMQRLELGTPRVGDALTSMVHLSHLDLGLPYQPSKHHDHCLRTDEGVARLADSLRANTALCWLSLAHVCNFAEIRQIAFPLWLQHLDVAGLEDSGLGNDEEFLVMHGNAPPPPVSCNEGVFRIARLTQLTSLRAGFAVSQATRCSTRSAASWQRCRACSELTWPAP